MASWAVGHDRPRAQRLEQLTVEERYHRQRLDLYRARVYGGRATSRARLEEFERVSEAAAARLRHERERGNAASVLVASA